MGPQRRLRLGVGLRVGARRREGAVAPFAFGLRFGFTLGFGLGFAFNLGRATGGRPAFAVAARLAVGRLDVPARLPDDSPWCVSLNHSRM